MLFNKHISSIFLGFLLTVLGLLDPVQADDKTSSLVVFGDSLSDPGNAWILTRAQSKAPFDLIPSAAYAIGGHHFTNGRTWVEQLAHEFDTRAGPAFRFSGQTNYAVGGARARPVGSTDLEAQVGLHLSLSAGLADGDALYVVVIGGNDVRDAIEAFAVDPSGALSGFILQSALTALYQNMALLAQSGAKSFMVGTAPDLGLAPAVRAQAPEVQFLANLLSSQFNQGLADTLSLLRLQYDIEISVLDIFFILQQVVANPEEYDFDVVASSCINPGVIAMAICSDPDDYLFWDGIHPTRAGHKLIAEYAKELLVTN